MKKSEKKFLANFFQFFVKFFRDFFNDLFSFFTTDLRQRQGSLIDDDDVRWKTMESGDFLRHTGS